MLFSTRINLSNHLSTEEHASSSITHASALKFGRGPMFVKHHLVGSLEVPEHYCKRRSSYCDQEDDEDKTDLEGSQPIIIIIIWLLNYIYIITVKHFSQLYCTYTSLLAY